MHMFEEEKRRTWLKKQLKKQILDFCNHQKVVIEVSEIILCLEELAEDMAHHKGIIDEL